ncbi:cilium assembly protein DZIP1L-like isoform X1 [Sycon ciliatum]|uniref:cilium assembly protein DZIP1L-like isoform X1 n=1 Tax=Sycon ciliatum TaxID=27933 RepID=UPI0031F6F4B8
MATRQERRRHRSGEADTARRSRSYAGRTDNASASRRRARSTRSGTTAAENGGTGGSYPAEHRTTQRTERSDGLSDDSPSEWDRSLHDAQGAQFSFRPRVNRLDWRKIASIDVNSVIMGRDFKALEGNLVNLTFCNVELEQSPSLDRNFMKVVKLLQLMVECLLYAQKELKEDSSLQREKWSAATKREASTSALLQKTQKKLQSYKKEMKNRKENIIMLQSLLKTDNDIQQCPYCPKQFVNEPLLHGHMERRHPRFAASAAIPKSTVAMAAPHPGETHRQSSTASVDDKLKQEEAARQVSSLQDSVQNLTKRLQDNEERMRRNFEEREADLNKEHQQALQEATRQEKQRHEANLQAVVQPLQLQIEQLMATQKAQEDAIRKSRSSRSRSTNLGDIEDANSDSDESAGRAHRHERRSHILEKERELLEVKQEREKQAGQILELKAIMKEQMSKMEQQQESQKDEWRSRLNDVEDTYRSKMQQMLLSQQEQNHREVEAQQQSQERQRRQASSRLDYEAQTVSTTNTGRVEERRKAVERTPQQSALPPEGSRVTGQAEAHTQPHKQQVPVAHTRDVIPRDQQGVDDSTELSDSDDDYVAGSSQDQQHQVVSRTRSEGVSHRQAPAIAAPNASAREDPETTRSERRTSSSGTVKRKSESFDTPAQQQSATYHLPSNQAITTRYNHAPAVIEQTRAEVQETIRVEMQRAGLKSGFACLSEEDFGGRMENLERSRQVQSVRQPGLETMRQKVRQQLEDITNQGYSAWKEQNPPKQTLLSTVPNTPPISPDKRKQGEGIHTQKKMPALKVKAVAALTAPRANDSDKSRPPMTPLKTQSSTPGGSSKKQDTSTIGKSSKATTPNVSAGRPISSSTPLEPSNKRLGQQRPVVHAGDPYQPSDSSSPLSDDEDDEEEQGGRKADRTGAAARRVNTKPIQSSQSAVQRPAVPAESPVYAVAKPPSKPGSSSKPGKPGYANKPPAIERASPAAPTTTDRSQPQSGIAAPDPRLPRSAQAATPTIPANAAGGDVDKKQRGVSSLAQARKQASPEDDEDDSSWEESISELNEAVGQPAASALQPPATAASVVHTGGHVGKDMDDSLSDLSGSDELAESSPQHIPARLHTETLAVGEVDSDDAPIQGTGRVRELAASLSSSMNMTPTRPPAGGLDLRKAPVGTRTAQAARLPTSELGIEDEDTFSLSSLEDGGNQAKIPARSSSPTAVLSAGKAVHGSSTANNRKGSVSSWKDAGVASGQGSLGAGSSIAVSSFNIEDMSDLSDDDNWP